MSNQIKPLDTIRKLSRNGLTYESNVSMSRMKPNVSKYPITIWQRDLSEDKDKNRQLDASVDFDDDQFSLISIRGRFILKIFAEQLKSNVSRFSLKNPPIRLTVNVSLCRIKLSVIDKHLIHRNTSLLYVRIEITIVLIRTTQFS